MTNSYQRLEQRFTEIAHLNATSELLKWDARTMMPSGAAASRADQLSTLARQKHRLINDPNVTDWLSDALRQRARLTLWQRSNLQAMHHHHSHASAVDETLAAAISIANAQAQTSWLQAKQDNDFGSFAPKLEAVLNLQRKLAQAKADVLGCQPFDALLDMCEPGIRTAKIDSLFLPLEKALPKLLQDIMAKQQSRNRNPHALRGLTYQALKKFTQLLCQKLGYTAEGARIDHTGHPFALINVPGDTRITVHYDINDPLFTLRAAVHEVGHAFYEQHLPQQWCYQPVGRARGFATHESQSLALDMIAFRSNEFIHFLADFLPQHLNVAGAAWSVDNLKNHIQLVKPGPIRIKADEVTYPLHVILRYRIERALLDGSLAIVDLPEAWNTGMNELLGVWPQTDSEGCLQDAHWGLGLWGYFPSYALGAIKAAQLFSAAQRLYPTLLNDFARGDVSRWVQWLAAHIHQYASLLSSEMLIREATGEPLNANYFLQHLKSRYLNE